MPKKLWVAAADHDEQGSFSDLESQHTYQNVSGFEKEVQIAAAGDRGDQAIVCDAPADPDDSYGADQRFNLYHTEEDSQGTDTPVKHSVGDH
jgi:hypothetical protein